MYKNNGVSEVTNGKLVLQNLGCVGIGLQPMPGSKGGFPVIAIINGDTTNPLRIENTGVYTHNAAIENVEVMVAAGGGVDGDKWRITLKQASGDGLEQRFPTNNRGELITARPKGKVLFDVYTARAPYAFPAAYAPQDGWAGFKGDLYVDPASPFAFTAAQHEQATTSTPWDLSDFEQVMLCVEMTTFGKPSPFVGSVEAGIIGRPLGDISRGLFTIYCGANGFGDNWDETPLAHAVMGARGAFTGAYAEESMRRAPGGTFFLRIDPAGDGLPVDAFANPLNHQLRFFAVGY